MPGLVQLPDTRGHVWHLKAPCRFLSRSSRSSISSLLSKFFVAISMALLQNASPQAEWTKSGDMVVDDSEAEQEAPWTASPGPRGLALQVAKRKEERRSRSDTAGGSPPARSPVPPPKGALHPGVPAPLPPLQTRYPQARHRARKRVLGKA